MIAICTASSRFGSGPRARSKSTPSGSYGDSRSINAGAQSLIVQLDARVDVTFEDGMWQVVKSGRTIQTKSLKDLLG